ncbi:hypothetical protein AX14_005801 [Amanita brunnescens Koide BX004]|nr:hypothetical protein AX14_005801 [Amanita brunnescens Koide BX004]
MKSIATLFTRRSSHASLDDSYNAIRAPPPSLTTKRQELDGLLSTPPYSPLLGSCDPMGVQRPSWTAMPQEPEELPGTPPHNRSAIDAQHLSVPTKQELLLLTPPHSPLSALLSISDSGVSLTAQAQKIGHELDESKKQLERLAKKQARRAKKQQDELATCNANWESRCDAERREKERYLAAQQTLDKRLQDSNAAKDRLHTEFAEQEQTLSAVLEDSERKDAEMHHLHASLDDSRDAIEAHRQLLTKMRQEFDELTRSRDELCHQTERLEKRIIDQASEADSLRGEIQQLADSLTMVEKKAADDLADGRRQLDKQALELAAVQKALESSLNDSANLRQELGSRQSDYAEMCSEFDEAMERHREDAQLKKQKIESLKKLVEEREVELAATQKQLESERQEILDVRLELGSLESAYDEKCSELEEAVRQHNADAEASRIRSEAREIELAAVRKELDNERGVTVTVRQELSLLKSDYGQMCSELEEIARQHEAKAQSLGQTLSEVQTTLDSETARRRQLEKDLDDARNEIMEKEQIIKASSLSLDEVQKVVTELQNALEQQLELMEDDDELSEEEY